jgi:iron complex outermembrane recepter protein
MKSRNPHGRWLAGEIWLSALISFNGAWGQTTSATPSATDNAGVLEEIVVTAEKRSEDLQKTPVAVQVINNTTLQLANVQDFTNITKVAPNVQVSQAAGATALEIRGVVTGSHDPTDESPIAVHLDGNYIARQNAINGMFYDIDRIEVLAGPQGTLYGRNSAGGAVNIITNKPDSSFGGHSSIEFGSYDMVRVESAVNVPVSDTVAVRFAGLAYSHSGYYQNGTDDAKEESGRVELLWKPSQTDSLLVTSDLERMNPKGPADNIVATYPGSITALPPQWNNSGVPSATFANPAPGSGSGPTAYYANMDRSSLDILAEGLSAQYDHEFNFADLTLQAAHRNMDQSLILYGAGGINNTPETSHTNTAELRLTSTATVPWQYVLGLYYFDETATGQQQGYSTIIAPTFLSRAILSDTDRSGAAFGQATWTPTGLDALHLTAGGRVNYDDKRGSDDVIIVPLNSHDPNTDVGKTWTDYTYKLGAAYDLTSANMLFANASTGYKAGGVAFGPYPIVPPEKNTAYEVGSKNRFLDNKLQVNIDYFRYKFTNPEFLTAATTVVNNVNVNTLEIITADYEHMQGVELSVDFAATAQDLFKLTANYLQGRINSLNLANPAYRVNGGIDLHDFPIFDSPPWTGLASYTHTFHAWNGSLDATASVFYIDAHTIGYPTRYTGLAASPDPSIQALAALQGTIGPAPETGSATIGDLSLRYSPDIGRWKLSVYVSNVNNQSYLYAGSRSLSGTNPLFNTLIGFQSPPRTYGAIFSTTF